MFASLARGGLLVLLSAGVVSTGTGQPGDDERGKLLPPPPIAKREVPEYKPFTAFPGLKPPVVGSNSPGGRASEETAAVPLPPLPVVAADAPPLRKVRHEQLFQGLAYIARIKEYMRSGGWTGQYSEEYLQILSEVFQVAADLEPTPARRVSWHEARVRAFKEIEWVIFMRVRNGSDPPQQLDRFCFRRLGTEADLLRVQAEAAKAGAADPSPDGAPMGPSTPIHTMEPPTAGRAAPAPDTPPLGTNEPPHELPPPLGDRGIDQQMEHRRRTRGSEPPFTAFPDIVAVGKESVPLPPIPAVAADAAPLRKVRFEQLQEGLAYIACIKEVIRIGSYTSQFLTDYLGFIAEVARIAGTLEDTPARRVPWYEARVRAFKEAERFISVRVSNAYDPPQRLDRICFLRLGAEAELLRLKAGTATGGAAAPPGTPGPDGPAADRPRRMNPPALSGDAGPTEAADPPTPPGAFGSPLPTLEDDSAEADDPATDKMPVERQIEQMLQKAKFRPTYTAFPDLKPPSIERGKAPGGDEKSGVVSPPLPAVGADAPPLRRVRAEQVRCALKYISRVKEIIRIGSYTALFFTEYIDFTSEAYRLAAELEDTPARRVPWYEARVRAAKEAEQFTAIRFVNGNDPPQRLNQIRFVRLQTEAELLELTAAVAAATPPPDLRSDGYPPCPCRPVPLGPCPPPVVRPRCGCFFHPFRRR